MQYPESYPDEAPQLDIIASQDATKPHNLDIREDKAYLLEALQPAIDENMGMAMVFTLVSALKETAEHLILERDQAARAVQDAEYAKAEEEENRKFQGKVVTRETFLEWRNRFKREMEEFEVKRQEEKEAEDRRKRVPKEDKKLTGKELWERGLAGKVDDDEDNVAEDLAQTSISS